MNLVIGSDHAGFDLKKHLKKMLQEQGHQVEDVGPESADSVDYPDFAHKLTAKVESGESDLGILMCGSGNGINMAANKHQGIRSALCWEPEIAKLARQHNNANVIALPARFIDPQTAEEIVNAFLEAQFEGGRHQNRVDKISC